MSIKDEIKAIVAKDEAATKARIAGADAAVKEEVAKVEDEVVVLFPVRLFWQHKGLLGLLVVAFFLGVYLGAHP